MSGDHPPEHSKDFVRQILDGDEASGKWGGVVHTRFPPEPNGYLHIGHAKSICLNFGIASEYGGKCNLRFDDTNPEKESVEYVESIKNDIRWLGFDWEERPLFASDYFQQLYDWAEKLITEGKAYVCSLELEEIRTGRGNPSELGTDSPYRSRTVEENLDLFRRMKAGEFDEGEHVLRAKIDMGHKVLLLRDPIMYRIRKVTHHHTGDDWCIYPTYDWTHGQSDSLEGITHSICTLEFENRRPLYDWYCDTLGIHHPQQIEFNRLNLTYTIMSKRKLLRLVEEGHVGGWDDPRMPTISGLRRRGYTPESIRNLCHAVGITKHNAMSDMVMLENQLREELNRTADRRMAVLDPLKVVITNYPADEPELVQGVNNPEDENAGSRSIPFGREIYIEQDDFMEDPPKKFFRLGPGKEVRLRWAYFIKCNDVVKDADGNVTELHCTYDVETKGGNAPDGRKVKGTIHWVNAATAVDAEVRLYDHLFVKENADEVDNEEDDFLTNLNPDSLSISHAKLEPALADANVGDRCQFERKGYFIVDQDSAPDKLVFNRSVTLRDNWAKAKKQQPTKKNEPKKNNQKQKNKK